MKRLSPYFLLGILLIAALLRLYKLGSNPPSLYWEEAALGYDAYSILKTGKDYHGNPWPLVAFESFGDYKPSGYFYAAIPFIAAFGLNEWGIRLPSAIAGIITVWLTYFIGKELTKNNRAALLGAFILAILPWHLQFSRAAFEVNLATALLTLGIYLWLKSAKYPVLIILSGLSLVFSMYTYHGLRVLAPLMGIFMFLKLKGFRNKWILTAGILALALLLPMIHMIKTPIVQQRFKETSLFSTSPAVIEMNRMRAEDGNALFSRIIHHRYWYWGREIVSGMLSHLSPAFLYLTGDENSRHQSGSHALFFLTSLVPLLVLVRANPQKQIIFFLAGWIILATLPPALTNLTPHTLRYLPAAPAWALLIGYGLALIKSRRFLVIVAVLTALEAGAYAYDYYQGYPVRVSQEWQYGYKELVHFINRPEHHHKQVYVTRAYGRPSIYVLFYSQYDPHLIQQAAATTPKDQGELLAIDRFHFGPVSGNESGILVNDHPLVSGRLLETIHFLNGKPAFYIYEN